VEQTRIITYPFYNSQGKSSKSRDFLKGGELSNLVNEKLKDAVEKEEVENLEETSGIAFTNLYESWQALKSSDKSTTAKTTKEGFIYTILTFLENQGLIMYIKDDDMIKTTSKLDNFMDWNILNKNNYERVAKALGGVDGE